MADKLIDRIPDLSSPRAQLEYGHTNKVKGGDRLTEALPRSYANAMAAAIDREQNPTYAMIETLRSEMMFAPEDATLVQNAYGVTRNLIDTVLYDKPEGEEAMQLVEATRWYAGSVPYGLDQDPDRLGSHSLDGYRLNLELIRDHQARLVERFVGEQGVELKNPTDARLLSLIHTAGHEAGHAILEGVSGFDRIKNRGRDGSSDHLRASAIYMALQPSEALTGNWDNDVWIAEERFAEGAGTIAAVAALETLGYQGREIEVFLQAFELKSALGIAEGQHQLDYLDHEHLPYRTFRDLMKEAVDDDHKRYMYEGYLGYLTPLGPRDMIKQLNTLAGIMKEYDAKMGSVNHAISVYSGGNGEWGKIVSGAQSSVQRQIVDNLREQRSARLAQRDLQAAADAQLDFDIGEMVQDVAPLPLPLLARPTRITGEFRDALAEDNQTQRRMRRFGRKAVSMVVRLGGATTIGSYEDTAQRAAQANGSYARRQRRKRVAQSAQ